MKADRTARRSFIVTLAALLLGAAFTGLAMGEGHPTNGGGVLILHAASSQAWVPDTVDVCRRGDLVKWSEARTRLPADGVPRVVLCYAAFASDTASEMKAVTFGIRYSPTVHLYSYGACTDGGPEFPTNGWPHSGGGDSVVNHEARNGSLIPVYWFVLSATGLGFFELTPNPLPNMGGQFANSDVDPRVESVTGFGRIGFGENGTLPEPGHPEPLGVCCVENGCYTLSEGQCASFGGTFLGNASKCSHAPCGVLAVRGACCLPSGCEQLTGVDCVKRGGVFLGEVVRCDSIPCPKPGPLGASGAAPDSSARADSTGSARRSR